jgi:hypothetical protein
MNFPLLLKQYPIMWLGVVVAVVMQFAGGGWWLDTHDRVVITAGVLAIVACAVGGLSPKRTWWPAIHLWTGFMVGITVILFIIGPGNIFPIVLAVGGGWAVMAVGLGFAIGAIARMMISSLLPSHS